MTQEEKKLLLKDLSARLPYEIIVKVNDTQGIIDKIDIPNERIFVSSLNPFLYGGAKAHWFTVNGDKIYPYLRPLSSMTEEEKIEAKTNGCIIYHDTSLENKGLMVIASPKGIDWLNAHHFDYRNLIEMNLALDCTKLNVYN